MKFSTKDRYALRLMVELAGLAPDAYLSIKDISARQELSPKYLEQIVTPLARSGLVVSGRGSQGGYRLARAAAEISAGDVLRAVEGEIASIPCLAPSAEDCPRKDICCTLPFWEGLDTVISAYVDGYSLEKLRAEYEARAGKPYPCK